MVAKPVMAITSQASRTRRLCRRTKPVSRVIGGLRGRGWPSRYCARRETSSAGPGMVRARVSCCWPRAGLNARRFGAVPVQGQALAPAEPAEVPGEDILNLPESLLVSGLDAQRQPVLAGLNRALAPRVEPDDA